MHSINLPLQVVIILVVGVMLEIIVEGDVPVIVKAEPRLAIIAFLFATLWEFIQIEWMTHCHHKNLSNSKEETLSRTKPKNVLDSLRFRSNCSSDRNSLACKSPVCLRASMRLILCLLIGLFLAGSIIENIRFTSVVADEKEGCVRDYNLYSLGTTLVSPFNLQANSAKPYMWILLFAQIILLAVLPLFVHLVHVLVCILNVTNERLCRIADICWTFASVDVFLIALYVVQVSKCA